MFLTPTAIFWIATNQVTGSSSTHSIWSVSSPKCCILSQASRHCYRDAASLVIRTPCQGSFEASVSPLPRVVWFMISGARNGSSSHDVRAISGRVPNVIEHSRGWWKQLGTSDRLWSIYKCYKCWTPGNKVDSWLSRGNGARSLWSALHASADWAAGMGIYRPAPEDRKSNVL
jgi:hypothetical protein